MKRRFVVNTLSLLLVFLGAYSSNLRADDDGADEIPRIPLYAEIHKLEDILASRPNQTEEAIRLSEIYFLTSRCNEALRVAPRGTLIPCACGGKCAKGIGIEKIEDFRRLLKTSNRWKSGALSSKWKSVKDSPEAQYFATGYLRQNPIALETPSQQELRANLEASLDSLEVRTIVE